MQDSVDNAKDSVPVLGRIPVLGDLFSYRNENTTKTELVIFMRPVVVKDASINGDYKDYRYILPGQTPDTEPYPVPPRRMDHESSNASAQESRARQTKRCQTTSWTNHRKRLTSFWR
jgi:type II secretory pathway component GspD/PulD (secretin)